MATEKESGEAQAQVPQEQEQVDENGLLPGGFHPFRPVLGSDDFSNVETNRARPLTDAVITIRVIKSFAYRSMKALVLPNIDLTTMNVNELKARCKEEVGKQPGFKAFRSSKDRLGEFMTFL